MTFFRDIVKKGWIVKIYEKVCIINDSCDAWFSEGKEEHEVNICFKCEDLEYWL